MSTLTEAERKTRLKSTGQREREFERQIAFWEKQPIDSEVRQCLAEARGRREGALARVRALSRKDP